MEHVGVHFIGKSLDYIIGELFPKIASCVERLSDDQVWWRPNESANSIANLILHVSGNARQYIVSGVGEAPDTRDRDKEFSDRSAVPKADVLGVLTATMKECEEVLKRLDPGSLAESRTIQGREITKLTAIYQVVQHFAMHTGQIILMTKILTGGDLDFYKFKDGLPIPQWKR